jgi:tetraacyldisaccharide 4'-kinase
VKNRVASWFEREWTQKSFWQILLLPVSWLFRCVTGLRRFAYRRSWLKSERLPVSVIVVGNITVGGSGKTPLVIWLVEYLRAAGYVPGVISRGYGGTERGPFEVGALSDAEQVGDEPVLIASRADVPLFIGRDRVAAGRALLAAHPNCDVIVSDDGLQHYRLQRAIEVAVVDGETRFGNARVLPAGPLREPLSRLRGVDFVVVNETNSDRATTPVQLASPSTLPGEAISMRFSGQVFYNAKDPEWHALPSDIRGQTLHAVAGIGRPQRFFDQLRRLGLSVVEHPFPDHHLYREADFAFGNDAIVLMTEKDAVKCRSFARETWWVLAVTAHVDERFGANLVAKLRPTYGPQTA